MDIITAIIYYTLCHTEQYTTEPKILLSVYVSVENNYYYIARYIILQHGHHLFPQKGVMLNKFLFYCEYTCEFKGLKQRVFMRKIKNKKNLFNYIISTGSLGL